jgi:putative aldouronate transport system substrate-binding protein
LNMRTWKQTSVIGMVSVMMLGAGLAGCSSGSGDSSVQGTGGGDSKKQVTLKVEVFDRGNSPSGVTVTDNFWTKWVQQNFGDKNNVKVEYVPLPRTEEVPKLNVLMASGDDAPDIVFTYDENTVFKYVEQGGLTDVSKLLDQYGPNLKAYLGDKTLEGGKFNGIQYSIPAKRVFLGKYASYIRKDWLDKVNMPVPKTTDELYQTLKAFKEKDPGGTGGQTIPLGMTIAPAQYEPLIWSFIKKTSEEERSTLTVRNDPVLMPGYKDALKFMNKLYNEGLMSPDFGLDKDKKKIQQDTMTGKVGFFSEDVPNVYQTNPGTYALLQKNIPNANLLPVDVYSNEEGKHAKPQYLPAGMFIMIPKASKNAVEAIKYLDWMAQKDVLFTMKHGMENTDYKLVNGLPVLMDTDETKKKNYNNGDMAIISNGYDFGSDERNSESMALVLPEVYRNDAKASIKIALSDTFTPIRFQRPLQSESKYATTLLDKYKEMIVKTTMAKPEEFEKVYDAILKDYMASGAQETLNERKAAYKEMKK